VRPEVWRRVDDCLADALELPAEERAAYLGIRLGDDPEARAEAERLIGQAEDAEKLFAHSPVAAWSGLGVGSRIGPWELERPLGSGGMGVVWLARRADGEANMRAAIKLLPPALMGPLKANQELLRRFLREKQILARLRHPNIAQLLDASAGGGDTPNFVMEFVEGQPITEYLAKQPPGLRARLALFLKVCDAVQYAHSNLVIHRDLKPQNILVNGAGEPKLLDFGIAKILNDPAGEGAVTLRRAFSLDYASPEQIRGGEIRTGADVYALGLLLYEVVTGERARRWSDLALGEVLDKLERFELTSLGALDAELRAVLEKATAGEESQRYRSVSELAADLERYLDGRPVEARAAGLGYQAWCFARRNRLAVLSSVFAMVIIIGLGAWGWISAKRASQGEYAALENSKQLAVALNAERLARKAEAQETHRAEQMENLAKQREAEAETRLRELLNILERLIRSARSEVAPLSGGLTVSVKLVEGALKQLESMKPSRAAAVNLLLLRSDAHSQLAELLGGTNSNLGDTEKSVWHLKQSLALWEQIAELRPEQIDWRRGLLEARFRAIRTSLRPVEDDPRWAEFEKEFVSLARLKPKDLATVRAIGSFYFRRASQNVQTTAKRRADYQRALQWFESAPRNPENPAEQLRDVALIHKYLAPLYEDKPSQRLHHSREAHRLDQQRMGLDLANASARIDLSFSMVSLAEAHWAIGERALAMREFWEAFEFRKAMALADPKNVFLARALIYPVRAYGIGAVVLENWEGVNAAIKEFDLLRERDATLLDVASMAHLESWRGRIAREEGRRAEACQHFESSLRIFEEAKGRTWEFPKEAITSFVKACQTRP